MRSLNTYYVDAPKLYTFIEYNHISDSSSLLIQVFTSKNDKRYIVKLLAVLTTKFPNAAIIGSTTDGEIMDAKVSTHSTVLSFTQFEHTQLHTEVVKHKKDGYFSGETLAKRLIAQDTKLIIAFADGLHTNGDAFLNGMNSVNNDVIVAGGLAGDNAKFVQTYVFTDKGILDKGAVGVALNSECLNVSNEYSFNWRRIGKYLTIIKVKDNRVYTIDGRTAVDTYIHYLGDEMGERLPSVGIEFPLICIRNGIEVARAVLAKHDDGSLTFAGNFKVGDKVKFGYGDPKAILSASYDVLEKIKDKPIESIFIYSCMARRHFMPDIIEKETLPLQQLAPVSGFFTYGEFFTSEKKELLNQAMTVVTLSENNHAPKEIKISKETDGTSSTTNALIHLINVTSKESMEQEAIEQAQNRFETLFKKSPDGILLIENDTFVQCNQKMLDIFEYVEEKDFLMAHPLQIFSKRQPDGVHSFRQIKKMKQIAVEKGDHQFEWVFKKQNGKHFWTEIMLTAVEIDNRDVIYVVCRDISKRKEMEIELERQKNILFYRANHDHLTGLANRAFFLNKLKKGLKKSKELNQKLVLMFIDLDRFKKINDSLGHSVGDSVIKMVGKRLKLVVDKEDIVARFAGDEFLVMMKNVIKHDDILAMANKILCILKEPIAIEHYTLYATASIGIARYPEDDLNANNLLKYADTAMYKAKEEGGNNYQFYTREMTDTAYEHVMMERDLREGIKNGDFEVYYQPQINVKTGSIIGVEALVRWNHPIVGLLAPDIFIPLSEKTGLIVELDLWVMKKAMSDISSWYKEGLNPGTLALNISMRQLEYPSLMEVIVENMKMNMFKNEWLELEITETEMMKNPEKVIGILNDLHDLGITIAIDDFGTGYSSLSHLKRLPIDKLKIDKSFIVDIPEDKTAKAIVNTMIVLADSLGLVVIAEGVETKSQQDFLVQNGCYQIQGYYYSKPIRAEAMKKMLRG